VVTTLGGAVQQPGNINTAHAGLHQFYTALMDADINRDAKKTIYLAVFWFGHSHEYNAVLVGPFGNELHQEEQMMTDSEKYNGMCTSATQMDANCTFWW